MWIFTKKDIYIDKKTAKRYNPFNITMFAEQCY